MKFQMLLLKNEIEVRVDYIGLLQIGAHKIINRLISFHSRLAQLKVDLEREIKGLTK